MSAQILLPQLGFSMNEGLLTEWLVADGTEVVEGQPIYAFEAEKSTQEVEAPSAGVLKIIAAAGETYPVGTLLATIG